MDHMRRARLGGWPLVGWCALTLACMAAAIFLLRGTGEAGWRLLIRATAETSFALFTAAFVASALARLRPSAPTRWMLRNRRYLGVSFAVSHTLHLAAIIVVTRIAADHFRVDPVTLIGGGTAYLFVAAMTATSFDRSAAWIGPRAWRLLHTSGAHFLWLIFTMQYLGLSIRFPIYAPLAVAAFAAMGVRIAAWLRGRRTVRAVTPLRAARG